MQGKHLDEGVILLAEAHPRDEESITLHLQYSLSAEFPEFKNKAFVLRKADAQMLLDRLQVLMALPPREAWEHIADHMVEDDPSDEDFEELGWPKS